nr:MAG TPA: hypothetical protein [Caudoviricetes sp.]
MLYRRKAVYSHFCGVLTLGVCKHHPHHKRPAENRREPQGTRPEERNKPHHWQHCRPDGVSLFIF